MMSVVHADHLHPRWDCCVTKEPTIGPAAADANTNIANIDTAIPSSMGSKKSTYVPPSIAIGAAPNTAWRKRQTEIVWRFCATARGI